ncbi:hypothetical protein [Amycolatopsis anabasis]|uniref:hypothetical protein n=1 Tax=Amycolatopsis anabasis TaxID=1840409 RepID=UPI001C555299|nr:hypothetical protein [Amycolatopsis anabasis]
MWDWFTPIHSGPAGSMAAALLVAAAILFVLAALFAVLGTVALTLAVHLLTLELAAPPARGEPNR